MLSLMNMDISVEKRFIVILGENYLAIAADT